MIDAANALARHVARHRRARPWRKLAALCRRYLAWYGNLDYDSASNGEHRVLQVLGGFAPRTIVDAGANVGDWSLAAALACPQATVHAFEVSPPTLETLRQRTAAEPRIVCHATGLADAPGQVHLRHYAGAPALTTASGYPHPLPYTEITAPVAAGGPLLAGLGVQHVDFLKIDVEGMEERVLLGFDAMLRERRIDLVQFEYGRVNILNGFLLHKSAAFFAERGYVVGKVYPNEVDFRAPTLDDEDFVGPNFLACRQDKPELLAALRGR